MKRFALLAALACLLANAATTSDRPLSAPLGYNPNQVLIQFLPGATDTDVAAALPKALVRFFEQLSPDQATHPRLVVATLATGTVGDAIARLKRNAAVEWAEPNWTYERRTAAREAYFTNGSLWGMYGDKSFPANGFGSQAAEAWARGKTGSRTVYVGIIDDGIQFDHPDLDANIWTNAHDPVDGVDNDGNGYIDDVHGWDFEANDNTIYDGGANGLFDNHGTHAAGVIGAEASNGHGVVGMNWQVTMIGAKFMGRSNGSIANVVRAIDYITDLKKRHGLNIVATNNSWGGGPYSQAVSDAIERANQAGILFVVSAGNGGGDQIGDDNDQAPYYPASYPHPNIISVASITGKGERSPFSNYGAKSVDIGAPGSGIYSTQAFDSYSSQSGTSMAAPHVTGAVALYAASHPGATASQIKQAILGSAIATPSLQGATVTGGRLNVGDF